MQFIETPKVQLALGKVFEQFLDNIFGKYKNRVDCDEFKKTLTTFSWCWFSIIDLNTIFTEALVSLNDKNPDPVIEIHRDHK
jgi:hypothetical protein